MYIHKQFESVLCAMQVCKYHFSDYEIISSQGTRLKIKKLSDIFKYLLLSPLNEYLGDYVQLQVFQTAMESFDAGVNSTVLSGLAVARVETSKSVYLLGLFHRLWPIHALAMSAWFTGCVVHVGIRQLSFKKEVGVRVNELAFRLILWWNVEICEYVCFANWCI